MSDVFLTPRQIYDELTGGPGSETLGNAQVLSHKESTRENDRAKRIARIGQTIQSGWQGTASDGAYGAAKPLADAAVQGSDELGRAQDLLDRQSGSFQRATNSVVPVSDGLPEMEFGDFVNPVDYEGKIRENQAAAEHNMQVFEGYDNASSHNETYAPREYPITNHSGGTISVTGGDTTGGGDPGSGRDAGRSGGDSGGSGGPGGGAPGSGGAPGGGPSGEVSPGGGPAPGAGGGPQQTRPNDYVPPAVAPPAGYQPPGLQPGPSTGNTGGQPGAVPVGGFSGGGTGGGGGGSAGGAGGRGGAAPGAGPRAGGLGVGGGVGAGAPGEAARGGVGAGAGARGGGAPGAMGAAPMGGGRGKGDDDAEHDRKYLVEPDPEEMFGSEVLTAPQVIGDDEYEDD